MLDKLKQIKQLREMQKMLAGEKIEHEKNGVKIIINGKMEVEEIKLNLNLEIGEQEKAVKDCINESIKKLQRTLVFKMQGMNGLGI